MSSLDNKSTGGDAFFSVETTLSLISLSSIARISLISFTAIKRSSLSQWHQSWHSGQTESWEIDYRNCSTL
jgi:hypothetical protein